MTWTFSNNGRNLPTSVIRYLRSTRTKVSNRAVSAWGADCYLAGNIVGLTQGMVDTSTTSLLGFAGLNVAALIFRSRGSHDAWFAAGQITAATSLTTINLPYISQGSVPAIVGTGLFVVGAMLGALAPNIKSYFQRAKRLVKWSPRKTMFQLQVASKAPLIVDVLDNAGWQPTSWNLADWLRLSVLGVWCVGDAFMGASRPQSQTKPPGTSSQP